MNEEAPQPTEPSVDLRPGHELEAIKAIRQLMIDRAELRGALVNSQEALKLAMGGNSDALALAQYQAAYSQNRSVLRALARAKP